MWTVAPGQSIAARRTTWHQGTDTGEVDAKPEETGFFRKSGLQSQFDVTQDHIAVSDKSLAPPHFGPVTPGL